MKRTIAIFGLLAVFPLVMQATDGLFYVSLASRILIYAIAATSLNLVLGYGGMVSFGHAAFFGAGAFVVGIMAVEGVRSAWIAWPVAIAVAALAALVIGAMSLRTRGVYFIMITLAFAQMLYYIFVSLKTYGGDDGLSMPGRSTIGMGVNLRNDLVWYYLVLALVALVQYGLFRLVNSRFGRVIDAIRENEARAEAIGFPVYRYKLLCFVISGAVAGLAGALIANQSNYVSPSLLHWIQSGTLMIMVILGGVGTLWGGLIGATVLLVLEHLIADYRIGWIASLAPNYQDHAGLAVGIVLLTIVMLAPEGIAGLFRKRHA
ncbi:MAG: branched-chain amino acid ABC transporter permease [Betaproteobacteria bacterium]|nr:branched-chain amino acid ABC transporter permease [Betaproteobacteria bacterium]MBV9361096.1 branched-chain amino acid ABC transporter permease [Betaproteobacteria bacterium]